MTATSGEKPIARPINWRRYWIICAVAVVTLALVDATRTLFTIRPGAMPLLMRFSGSLAWIAWAVTMPALVIATNRYPIRSARDYRRFALHAAFFVPFHFVLSSLTFGLVMLVNPRFGRPLHAVSIFTWLDPVFTVVLYASFAAILHLIFVQDRIARFAASAANATVRESKLRERVARQRLETLQQQLRPHFLFNTLNTITATITRDPKQARELIVRLSDLLRRVLADDETDAHTLRDEIAFISDYLDLQRARFRDSLTFEINIEPELQGLTVPRLILQPIVENAVEHGTGPGGTCRLEVDGRQCGDVVELVIRDHGPGIGIGETRKRGHGMGIPNTRERLEAFYGPGASLTLANEPSGGAIATLRLPKPVAS